MGIALQGIRDRVLLAGHAGFGWDAGGFHPVRDRRTSENGINDLLSRLHIDRLDVLWLSFVDSAEDYRTVMAEDGLLGLVRALRRAGTAGFIGLSTHVCSIAAQAVASGEIDVLMFPVNAAHDLVGDRSWEDAWKAETYQSRPRGQSSPGDERHRLYLSCVQRGVALVAMKPFAGGLLLSGGTISSAFAGTTDVRTGDLGRALAISLTPAQCLSYVLSQPGVSTALPGCRTPEEVRASMAYFEASPELKDFSGIDANALWKLRRQCVYCNHCLPCPAGSASAAS